jgi:hypothetical protein
MKNSLFSNWIRQKWLENRDEHQQWGEQPLTIQEYWGQHKWWLKKEYRKSCNQ